MGENDNARDSYWKRLLGEGPDRHIELLLALIIAVFAGVQLYTTISNNSRTSAQSERLLDSANRVDDAAESFSKSSADISRSMNDAVNKLNLQAASTQALAGEATIQARAAERQANATNATAIASGQSVKIASQQLDSSERPWVKVNVALLSSPGQLYPVSFNGGRLLVSAVLLPQNVGRSPAIKVRIRSKLIPSPAASATALQRTSTEQDQKEICDQINAKPVGSASLFGEGDTLFPDDQPNGIRQSLFVNQSAIEAEIAKPSNNRCNVPGMGSIQIASDDPIDAAGLAQAMCRLPGASGAPSFSIIGCVDYSIDYSGVRHQTVFLYDLEGIDFKTSDASHATLTKHSGWGNSAN